MKDWKRPLSVYLDRTPQGRKIKEMWRGCFQYSSKHAEIKYWKKAGIQKGLDFYEKYLRSFQVQEEDFCNKAVGDFGSGPFGGLLSVLKVKTAYPIDILADDYNEWKTFSMKIYKFDGRKTDLPKHILDVLFCCNALDHTKYPQYMIKEIHRLLKPSGTLYLHVHMREKHQLNETHPEAWDTLRVKKSFHDFRKEWIQVQERDAVNNKDRKTLYAKLIRK